MITTLVPLKIYYLSNYNLKQKIFIDTANVHDHDTSVDLNMLNLSHINTNIEIYEESISVRFGDNFITFTTPEYHINQEFINSIDEISDKKFQKDIFNQFINLLNLKVYYYNYISQIHIIQCKFNLYNITLIADTYTGEYGFVFDNAYILPVQPILHIFNSVHHTINVDTKILKYCIYNYFQSLLNIKNTISLDLVKKLEQIKYNYEFNLLDKA